MAITNTTLASMMNEEGFIEEFSNFATGVMNETRLFPKFSMLHLSEAHSAWSGDILRIKGVEPNLGDGLDHFKQAGHLAFWIRRSRPIVEAIDIRTNLGDAEGLPLTPDEEAFRELLFGYVNEYLAFDFGYQICKFYETGKINPSNRARTLSPDEEYYRTMCYFLKYKTVSPHALFLIYKSLFLS